MKRKVFFILISIVVSVCFFSCLQTDEQARPVLVVASWNVQNLFDSVDDGTEYSEYKSSGGWTDKMYKTKLDRVVKALCGGMLAQADIIVLNEVENENVVKDILSDSRLKARDFYSYSFAKNGGGAVGTAVISSVEIKSSYIHQADTSLRPVLECDFETDWGTLCLLAVHSKSKDGDNYCREERYITAETIRDVASQRIEEGYGTIIAAGDFNEEYSENNMMGSDNSYPLYADGSNSIKSWYCFWADNSIVTNCEGSYYYNSAWEKIDNILVLRNTGMWEVDECNVDNQDFLATAEGIPNSFDRKLLTGVSDHFPVWIRFI